MSKKRAAKARKNRIKNQAVKAAGDALEKAQETPSHEDAPGQDETLREDSSVILMN